MALTRLRGKPRPLGRGGRQGQASSHMLPGVGHLLLVKNTTSLRYADFLKAIYTERIAEAMREGEPAPVSVAQGLGLESKIDDDPSAARGRPRPT